MHLSRLVFVLAALTASCSTTHQTVSESFPIIDVHTHTVTEMSDYEAKTIAQARADYLANRKEAGVVASIAHTLDLNEGYMDMKRENVLHCAGIRPPVRVKELEEGLKSKKYGCIKIYLGYIHHYANDPIYEPVYELSDRYGVPVIFHTGDTIDPDARVKFADPMPIDDVAVKHRKTNFVIAHCGNPWIDTAAELAYKNKNVYLDLSAFLVGDLDQLPVEKTDELVSKPIRWIFNYVENPKKLMFGTDYPLTRTKSYIAPVKRAIPQEYWKDVFYNNAIDVFKLKLKKE